MSAPAQIVADELRKNIAFRLLITLAYPQNQYDTALRECASVISEHVVNALKKQGAIK